MKKALVLVGILAAVANGAVWQFHTLGTSSIGGSISSDGTLIAGSTIDTSVLSYRFPAYWTVDVDGGTAPVKTTSTAVGVQATWVALTASAAARFSRRPTPAARSTRRATSPLAWAIRAAWSV